MGQREIIEFLKNNIGKSFTAQQIAEAINVSRGNATVCLTRAGIFVEKHTKEDDSAIYYKYREKRKVKLL